MPVSFLEWARCRNFLKKTDLFACHFLDNPLKGKDIKST